MALLGRQVQNNITRKHVFSSLVLFSILMVGCTKQDPIEELKYVPGDVLVGITSDAHLGSLFDTLNMLGLPIVSMTGFSYNYHMPPDSLEPLLTYLNTKPYINPGNGWNASAYYYPPEHAIRVFGMQFDMDLSDQLDHLQVIDSLGFVDRMGEGKSVHLRVPVGSENYWLGELKKYSFVRWAELNRIHRFGPF